MAKRVRTKKVGRQNFTEAQLKALKNVAKTGKTGGVKYGRKLPSKAGPGPSEFARTQGNIKRKKLGLKPKPGRFK
jgi:hypothetical protein